MHHLNYGIFLLAAVAAYLLFARPAGRAARVAAWAYGIAIGLTFDEFGMWLHLGGSYWQRASVDAVIVVAGVLGVVAFAPSLESSNPASMGASRSRRRPRALRVRPVRHRRAHRDARRAAPAGAGALVVPVGSASRASRGAVSSAGKESPCPIRPFLRLRFPARPRRAAARRRREPHAREGRGRHRDGVRVRHGRGPQRAQRAVRRARARGRGTAEVTIAGAPHRVSAGDILRLPANEPHALRATTPFKMILVMVKA